MAAAISILEKNDQISNIWYDEEITLENYFGWCKPAVTECTGGEQIPFYIEMTWKDKTKLDKFVSCQDDSFAEINFMIHLVQSSENKKLSIRTANDIEIMKIPLTFMYKYCSHTVDENKLSIMIPKFLFNVLQTAIYKIDDNVTKYFYKTSLTSSLFDKVSMHWNISIKKEYDLVHELNFGNKKFFSRYANNEIIYRSYRSYDMDYPCYEQRLNFVYEDIVEISKIFVELFDFNVDDIHHIFITWQEIEFIKIDKMNMLYKCDLITQKLLGIQLHHSDAIKCSDLKIKIFFNKEKKDKQTTIGIHMITHAKKERKVIINQNQQLLDYPFFTFDNM